MARVLSDDDERLYPSDDDKLMTETAAERTAIRADPTLSSLQTSPSSRGSRPP